MAENKTGEEDSLLDPTDVEDDEEEQDSTNATISFLKRWASNLTIAAGGAHVMMAVMDAIEREPQDSMSGIITGIRIACGIGLVLASGVSLEADRTRLTMKIEELEAKIRSQNDESPA